MLAPRCTVIIANFNGKHFLRGCLASLREQSVRAFDILLVDNGSCDGSVQLVEQEFPEIRILRLKENVGFCKANNLGIQDVLSRGREFVLLLNNDTVVAPDFVEHMLNAIEDPTIAAACPKIYFADRPQILWYAGADFSLWTSRSRYTGGGKEDAPRFDKKRSITQATGCAMLVRVSAIREVGLLDERFWAYVEDLDWTIRFRDHGYQVVYEPGARLWHHDGGSSVAGGSQSRRQYLTTRNLLLLCREHARWWQRPSFLLGFLIFHVGFYTCLRLKRWDLPALRAIYQGVADSLRSADSAPNTSALQVPNSSRL